MIHERAGMYLASLDNVSMLQI